jgi:hypothetical protein
MKVNSIHNRFTRKFAAKALGACMTAGLAIAVATPAQADVYPNDGYPIPFYFDSNPGLGPGGVDSQYIANGTTMFTVQAYVQARGGWINGLGTIGENRPLEALKVTQRKDLRLCLQPYVSGLGWTNAECTTGVGSTIQVGTTGQSRAILAVTAYLKDCKPGDYLNAREHMAPGSGWKDYKHAGCGETLQIGSTTNAPLFIDAIELYGGGNTGYQTLPFRPD